MNDKQQLAAMGEHMREMEECNQQKHSATQVMAWAGDYEKEGGHGLIVEMLKSYSELLNSSQCKREFKVPDGWRLVPDMPSSEMIVRGGEEFFDSARAWERGVTITDQDYAIMIYCQMLAAAPEYKP